MHLLAHCPIKYAMKISQYMKVILPQNSCSLEKYSKLLRFGMNLTTLQQSSGLRKYHMHTHTHTPCH